MRSIHSRNTAFIYTSNFIQRRYAPQHTILQHAVNTSQLYQ